MNERSSPIDMPALDALYAGVTSKLKAEFNLKEVLGNYCQPHLPPPRDTVDKDSFTKGAELYSWQDYNGYIWYALLPGTNRTKNTKELNEIKMSSGFLKQELKNLPKKIQISWNNLTTVDDKSNLDFTIPDEKTVKDIVKSAKQVGLEVIVVK